MREQRSMRFAIEFLAAVGPGVHLPFQRMPTHCGISFLIIVVLCVFFCLLSRLFFIVPQIALAIGVLTVLVKGPWMVSRSVHGCRGAFSIVIYTTW